MYLITLHDALNAQILSDENSGLFSDSDSGIIRVSTDITRNDTQVYGKGISVNVIPPSNVSTCLRPSSSRRRKRLGVHQRHHLSHEASWHRYRTGMEVDSDG